MVDPAIVRFLAALEETQYLAPDRMAAYQRRLLGRLLRHARAETPLYAERLAPLFRADDSIDWDRWTEIPILTRTEAQEAGDALFAHTVPQAAGETISAVTSGSTGRPLRHATSAIQTNAAACANERIYRWHGLDPAALIAFIRATSAPQARYPEGRRTSGWRLEHPDSPAVELAIASTAGEQVDWLRRKKPSILATYPSILREIGRLASEQGEPLAFDALLTVGETLSDATRSDIRRTLRCDPIDQYGSTEIGHIAGTCPHSGRHHIASELVLIEIVDETGRLLPAGARGRIVATAFYNFATPLIRYDAGDLGILSADPCGCGRTLPTFERILGRTRNIFRFADGSRKWPVLLSADIQMFVPHRQWQFVQTALDRVEFRYVAADPDQHNDLAGLAAYVRERLHPSVSVTATAMDEIKRSPSGKYEDFVSLL